jgi:hypothetical protein
MYKSTRSQKDPVEEDAMKMDSDAKTQNNYKDSSASAAASRHEGVIDADFVVKDDK